jgi:homoserine dehydrogenase
MTTDWQEVVNDPEIQIVIELVGGTGIAKTMILAALAKGKTVVTANKALLSAHGPELFAAAAKTGANLYYEASVCGGIPIIKAVREGFVANQFPAIYGIVNGTCNYILSRMKSEGAEFTDVLADAQKHGYAETPPDLDIDGCDAQHKIGILASLAHGFWVDQQLIHTEGIREISKIDMQFAEKLGYTIKLLGIAKQVDGGKPGVQVSVYPALIPNAHVLASVNGVFNACFVRGDIVGDTLFYGRGAGKDATASAVLSDVADAALDLKNGANRVAPFNAYAKHGRVVPMDEIILALLPPLERGGQTRHPDENRHHFCRRQNRHLVRLPAGRPRGRKRAAHPDDPRRAERRHAQGAGENREAARRQGPAGDDPRGKF